jgi:uncharacterized protein YtpQ (UPF0354 family)
MEIAQLITEIKQVLSKNLDPQVWTIESDQEQLRIRHQLDVNLGFSLSLPILLSKIQNGNEQEVLEDAVQRVLQLAKASEMKKDLKTSRDRVFPVLRSMSHPTQKQDVRYIHTDHTAESRIFYALDLGQTYVLVDEDMLSESGWSEQEIKQYALDNLKRLDMAYKEDEVAGNKFFFFSQRDGYAASRILNEELMTFMRRTVEQEMGVAIPHQDVLIVADIRNETGFKVLAKLTMDFCIKGDIPISPLPFLFTKEGSLEAIMIMSNPGAAPDIKKK